MFAYVAIVAIAFATRVAWLGEIAAAMLTTLLLFPALRRASASAWLLWLVSVGVIAALALRGHGDTSLDLMPAIVNAVLCLLFSRTLSAGREPLIARAIGAVEGADRLALPGVADYARHLTLAWALFLGAQAIAIVVIVGFAVPGGVLAVFGVKPPFEVSGSGWRWYVHLGSYFGVLVFFALEYAFRRWHLRHIPHVPPARFAARLIRRWPALVRSLGDDSPRAHR